LLLPDSGIANFCPKHRPSPRPTPHHDATCRPVPGTGAPRPARPSLQPEDKLRTSDSSAGSTHIMR
jgi:hypothetical protein